MLYKISEVVRRVALSRATIYKLIAQNKFPKPIHIGRSARWRAEDINRFIAGLQ